MEIHSLPENVNLPKASTNVQLGNESEITASVLWGKLVEWPVAAWFGHLTHSLTLPKHLMRKKEKGHLCYDDIVNWKSEILQGFHLYYYIYGE